MLLYKIVLYTLYSHSLLWFMISLSLTPQLHSLSVRTTLYTQTLSGHRFHLLPHTPSSLCFGALFHHFIILMQS